MVAPSSSAYVPNYKFIAEKQEKEFDEWVRPLVKDKDTEEKFRGLFAKAHGLDAVKERQRMDQEKNSTLRSENENLKKYYGELDHYVNKGDFDTFMQRTKIPEKLVLNWVLQKLKYQDMDADTKRAYDQSRELNGLTYAQAQQLEQLSQENQTIRTQQRVFELDQALSKPEATEVVRAYDEMAQQNGFPTFRQEVVRRAKLHVNETGEDITADEIVGQTLKWAQAFARPQQSVQNTQSPQVSNSTQKKPAVIPVVGGGNTSPVAQGFNSLEDIVKYRQEKFGS